MQRLSQALRPMRPSARQTALEAGFRILNIASPLHLAV